MTNTPALNSAAAIEIKDLVFTYPDGTRALQNISCTIARGESIGIIGQNGAGKSTFVNHLNGCFLPQQGVISILGAELKKKTREQIRRLVGVVFQNPDDQLFMPRVIEDIAFGPINAGVPAAEVEERCERVLRDLGLWEMRDRPPSHLSQGQKHFAALATVLVMDPEIIVLDEPTSDLDPRNRRRLIERINGLTITCIAVSHDLDFIWDTCERVLILANGTIAAHGPTRTILSDKALLERWELELPLRLQQ
jgi:cobalt/nickel transport system ATP-binding protein